MAKNKFLKGKYLALFIASILLIAVSFYYQDEIAGLGSLGYLGIFIVNFLSSVTLFLPGPGLATTVAGGIIFNPLLVAIAASLGSALGDVVCYVVGKSGKEILINQNTRRYLIFKEVFHKSAFFVVFIFALIPNPIF